MILRKITRGRKKFGEKTSCTQLGNDYWQEKEGNTKCEKQQSEMILHKAKWSHIAQSTSRLLLQKFQHNYIIASQNNKPEYSRKTSTLSLKNLEEYTALLIYAYMCIIYKIEIGFL